MGWNVRRVALIGGLGALALVWAIPSPAQRGLMLFDGTGRPVGAVVSLDTDTGLVTSVVEHDGQLGLVVVGADALARGNGQVFFEADDCTGPPLLSASPGPVEDPIFQRTGLAQGNVLLVATEDEPFEAVVQSTFAAPPGCQPFNATTVVFPTTPFLDLGGLRPPFTVR